MFGNSLSIWRPRRGAAPATPTVTLITPAAGVWDFGAQTASVLATGFPGALVSSELLDGSTVLASSSSFSAGVATVPYTVPSNNAGVKSLAVRVTDSLGTVRTTDAVTVTFGQGVAEVNATSPLALYWGKNGTIDPANGKAGDQISAWLDLTGQGRHATQPDTAFQPTLTVDGSDDAILFDPADTGGNFLILPASILTALSSGTAATWIIAARRASAGTSQTLFSLDGSELQGYISLGNNHALEVGSNATYGYYAVGANVTSHLWYYAINCAATGNANRAKVDEDTTAKTLTFFGNIPAGLTAFAAGRIGMNTAGTQRWRGPIMAVVPYARELNPIEKAAAIAGLDKLLAFR